MPRAFDSDAVARGTATLCFTENIECPGCALVFEGLFIDDSLSVEDMTDPPVGTHHCPQCGAVFTTEFSGWHYFSEAG